MKLSNIYSVVTANYWAFTLTDGSLRLLVVGHFHEPYYYLLEKVIKPKKTLVTLRVSPFQLHGNLFPLSIPLAIIKPSN